MAESVVVLDEEKQKQVEQVGGEFIALEQDDEDHSSASPSSSDDSESDSDSSTSSDSSALDSDEDDEVEEVTAEYLQSLLDKARRNAREEARRVKMLQEEKQTTAFGEDEFVKIGGEEEDEENKNDDEKPLPPLNPGVLPAPYFEFGKVRHTAPMMVRDPDVTQAEAATSSISVPAPPEDPNADWKQLTKKERKALKNKTAGPGWFDLPAPAEADLPKLYREVEALRLRNQLDPKRFYRKDDGESKGIKGLPKHFAIGTILPSTTPFGTASTDNLPRAQRKRTLVDELVDDAEAKRYAKKKFDELQSIRSAKGKKTLRKKNELRKPKW